MLGVVRSFEQLPESSAHTQGLRETMGSALAALRLRDSDLRWLVGNPFWLASPLEPLFRGLGWSVGEVVYLLCAVLTDQKVLLHATDPAVLLPAAQALRTLMVPLEYSSLYIPYLPATLLRPSDAITLLNDSTQPYLIGTHSSLLQARRRAAPRQPRCRFAAPHHPPHHPPPHPPHPDPACGHRPSSVTARCSRKS